MIIATLKIHDVIILCASGLNKCQLKHHDDKIVLEPRWCCHGGDSCVTGAAADDDDDDVW